MLGKLHFIILNFEMVKCEVTNLFTIIFKEFQSYYISKFYLLGALDQELNKLTRGK